MIAVILFVLLSFGGEFGMSATFCILCAADGAENRNDFFKFDRKSQRWNLMVALGVVFLQASMTGTLTYARIRSQLPHQALV